jgi:hypothetical protein
MNSQAFNTELTITGPVREPRQMLADQEYDGHASVHDEATADKLPAVCVCGARNGSSRAALVLTLRTW